MRPLFAPIKLVIVPDSGHSMSEPGIRSALIEATDKMAAL